MHSAIAEAKHLFGVYKKCEQVELHNIKRLIFICSGNICRSPLGEAFAKSHGVAAESFGLDTRGGDPADPRAVKYAAEHMIDLNTHRTRHIQEYVPAEGDLLIGMEPTHVKKLQSLYLDQVPVTLAGLWLENPVVYLHDPYNTNSDFFNSCSSLVKQSAKALAAKIK